MLLELSYSDPQWWINNGIFLGGKLLLTIAILVIGLFVAKKIAKITEKLLQTREID